MQIKSKYLYIPNKYYDFLTFNLDGMFPGVLRIPLKNSPLQTMDGLWRVLYCLLLCINNVQGRC